MTWILVALIALYATWRFANVVGRRQARRYDEAVKLHGMSGGSEIVEVCSRCGRYLKPGEIAWEGTWPARRAVCAGGCGSEAGDDG